MKFLEHAREEAAELRERERALESAADERAVARRRVYRRSLDIMLIVKTTLMVESGPRKGPPVVVDGKINPEWIDERSRQLAMALADLFEDDTQQAVEPVDWNTEVIK
jgi:hypothetical protein